MRRREFITRMVENVHALSVAESLLLKHQFVISTRA
jgi:hypothetical protein